MSDGLNEFSRSGFNINTALEELRRETLGSFQLTTFDHLFIAIFNTAITRMAQVGTLIDHSGEIKEEAVKKAAQDVILISSLGLKERNKYVEEKLNVPVQEEGSV